MDNSVPGKRTFIDATHISMMLPHMQKFKQKRSQGNMGQLIKAYEAFKKGINVHDMFSALF